MADSSGKILYINPNREKNGLVPNEDLTIYVSLETFKKGRSLIAVDGAQNNGQLKEEGSKPRPIKFINGSKSGEGRSLTTRYTEGGNPYDDDDEDFESLGIENIDIQFDTAYTPMIKIKFIDVRGQAIFQRGKKSKYSVFFELPFPLFVLTVKGFYGNSVKYCLHLRKWNSRFNAQTGNFEIDAEFIGYTYAILTDLLLGLIRACVYTKRGEEIFNEIKNEYASKSFELKTIDEFLKDIDELGNLLDKISQDDEEIKQINLNIDIREKLKTIRTSIETILKDVYDEEYFKTVDGIIVVPSEKYPEPNVNAIFNNLKDKLREGIGEKNTTDEKTLNYKITEPSLKIDLTRLTNFVNTFKITKSAVTVTELIRLNNKYNEDDEYNKDSDRYGYVQKLVDKIENFGKNINSGSTINIYDLRDLYSELDKSQTVLDRNETETRERVAEKLREASKNELGFDPTIRNVFTIFTTHCEVFLQLLYEVSKSAEESNSRKGELEKLITDLNYVKGSGNFYPWPEYRKKSDEKDGGYTESWLGTAVNNPEKVNEIVFVEEMLKALLDIAKRDEPEVIGEVFSGPQFYPVSSIDSIAGKTLKNLNNNPYIDALTGPRTITHIDEATRCLMMRGFLGLGVHNFTQHQSPGVGGNLPKDMCTFMGYFEAENLYQAFLTMDKSIARERISGIDSIGGSGANPNKKAEALIKFWSEGSENISNPPSTTGEERKKVPLLSDGSSLIIYNYITDDEGENYILPISGIFDGRDFYGFDRQRNGATRALDSMSDEQIKSMKEKRKLDKFEFNKTDGKWDQLTFKPSFSNSDRMAEASKKVDFISNNIDINDSSIKVSFLTENEYNSNGVTPNYGSDVENYLIESYIKPTISDLGINTIQKSSINVNYNTGVASNKYIEPFLPYGRYRAKEFFDLTFTENESLVKANSFIALPYKKDDSATASVFTLFYHQPRIITDSKQLATAVFNPNDSFVNNMGGTYLAAISSGRFITYTNSVGTTKQEYKNKIQNIDNPDYYFIPNQWGAPPYNKKYKQTHILSSYGNTKGILGTLLGDTNTYDVNEINVPFIEFGINNGDLFMSLFGSRFYDIQDEYGKAFLFLHTIPWAGITDGSLVFENKAGSIEKDATATLKGLFKFNGGFIKSPYLWCAFIGGILYRIKKNKDDGTDILKWTKFNPVINVNEPVIPYFDSNDTIPTNKFLKVDTSGDGFNTSKFGMDLDGFNLDKHLKMDQVLEFLSPVIKDKFIEIFIRFKDSTEWQDIRNELELNYLNNTYSSQPSAAGREWEATWDGLNSRVQRLVSGTATNPNTGEPENPNKLDYQAYLAQQAEINLAQTTPTTGTTNTVYTKFPEYQSPVDDETTPPYVLKNKDISELLGENVLRNYEMVSPTGDNEWSSWSSGKAYQYNLTLKSGTKAQNTLRKLFSKVLIINNVQPSNFADYTVNGYELNVKRDEFKLYLEGFFIRFGELKKKFDEEQDKTTNQLKQKIFNSIDNDSIKLQLYRTFSAIYNKWIAGSDGNLIYQCQSNPQDKDVALYNRGKSTPRLIDSFRFLDRAFNYIGDKFFINPLAISNLVRNNYNQSFFDLTNTILKDNNFNFIALPNFINFNDKDELVDMFTPFPYVDENKITGPAFICNYVGQASSNLDLGDDYETPDDGFHIQTNENGQIDMSSLPEDFNKSVDVSKGELFCPVIDVTYGQQNQSFFKDIKLDQSEFTETMESLEIIEELSKSGDKRKPTLIGQNLFNIYQTRSYTAEIEMMGCILIQPMMYFNLKNIPMFRGMYMIFGVSHSITPNSMTTTFKGNRVKAKKTEIIDAKILYMNLLSSIESKGAKASTSETGNQPLTASQSATLKAMRTVDQSTINALDFGNPFDGNPILTSPVGPRDAGSNASPDHKGVDIGTTNGSNIKMIGTGEVELVRLQNNGKESIGYGLYMITKHTTSDGKVYRALYAHLSDIDKSVLDLDNLTTEQKNKIVGGGLILNKSISKGKVIAKSGGGKNETGNIKSFKFNGSSSGPHLHFEIKEEVRSGGSGFPAYYNNSQFKDPLLFIPYGYDNPKYASKRYSPHNDTNEEVNDTKDSV